MQYEVNSNETLHDYLVNITEWTCSCRKWQATGIPCSHALGVNIGGLKDNPQAYTRPFTAWMPSTTHTLVPLCIRITRSIIPGPLFYLPTSSPMVSSPNIMRMTRIPMILTYYWLLICAGELRDVQPKGRGQQRHQQRSGVFRSMGDVG